MKLFLSSSGLSNTNQQSFLDLVGRDVRGLRVAFIPTAMNEESEATRQKYISVDVADLTSLGMHVEFVDLEKLNEGNIVSAFASFDIVYVYGGNTFNLMHHVHHSGFRKHIHEIIDGKIYFGVSAGSMIVGQNIALAGWEPAADPNTIGLTDMTGIALVPFSILPHWNGAIPKEATAYPHKIRYVKDEDAIVIADAL